ncbi:putative DNA replication protein [uncultured Mediterranean phage uvMED]|nr:putative DNA replication protein [uncultured Mediterranean phage uvMED]
MKPNYYAIIPAEVRYDDKLSPNAKLLFGEITALSNKKGYSWASNKYFAELYDVDKKTVSRWVKQLEDLNYISSVMEYDKETKRVVKRTIKINSAYPMDKNVGGGQKDPQGGDKNVQVNIYSNNNNNIKNNSATFKKVSDFNSNYLKAYDHLIELFDERDRPKNTNQKINWLNVIRLCDTKDNVNPRQLYWICKKAVNDHFWSKNFLSIAAIREKKKGVSKLNRLIKQFGGKEFDILADDKA